MATLPNTSQSDGRLKQSAYSSVSQSPRSKLGSAWGVRDQERQRRAIELKIAGWTYAAIAKELGVSRQRIQQIVKPSPQTLRAILDRSKGRCEKCGQEIKGHAGHVHHLKAQDEYNALENLLYLCIPCHREEHTAVYFSELPPGPERRRAAEAFIQPFLGHVSVRHCIACGATGATLGLCAGCRDKYKAIAKAKSNLANWQRQNGENWEYSLSQAIYEIRKNNLTPADFEPRRPA